MTTTQTQVRSTDEALKLALEALDWAEFKMENLDAAQLRRKIHAIKEALSAERVAQPDQEPVALETVYETVIQWDEGGGKRSRRELARRIVSLYTTPPYVATPRQRPSRSDIKPLTDEQIFKVLDADIMGMENAKNDPESWAVIVDTVRAVEAAHGITASEAEDSARSKT